MNDTVLFIVVITGALVLVLGTAYAMDRRRKSTMKAEVKVLPGPVSRIILWISYGVLVITVLFIIGAFAFNQIGFANLAWNFIFLYIIAGIIYRIARPRGL
jgi:hypothetical protein